MRRTSRIEPGLPGEPARSYLKERRLMRRVFKASLMSDSKWRKLFLAIERLKLGLPVCRVKWTDIEHPRTLRTPGGARLWPPRPFVDTMEFGPFPLCAIEWLEFPRDLGMAGGQDVDRAERALQVVARFPMENTPEGRRIIGHLRRS